MLHSNPANSRTAFSTAASPGFFEKQQEITAEQIAKEFENNNPSFDHHFRKDRLSEKDRVTITEVADLLLKERLRRYKTHPGINDPHNTDKYEIMSSEIATLINLAIALSSTTRSPENTTKINRAINGLVGAILHPKEELSVNWKLALCASLVTGCMIFISLFIPWITGLSVVNLLASQFLGIPMSSVLISAPLWLGKAIEYFFFSPSTIQIKIRQIEEVSKDVSATEASISVLRDEVADLLTKAEHTQSILKEADALEKIKALQVSLCSLEKRHEEGRERTKDLRYIYSILASVKELLSQWTSPTKARDMQENTLEVFLNEMHGAVSLVPVKEGTIRSILTTYILPAAPVVLFLLLVGGLFCGSYGIIGLSTNMTFLGTQALFWLKDVISAITPSKEGAASLISQKINATEAQNIMPDLIKTIRKSTKIGDSKVYRVETVPHSSASESSSSYVKLLRIPLSSTAAPALAVSDAAKLSRRKSGQRHRSSAISSHNAQSTSDHSPSSRRSSR